MPPSPSSSIHTALAAFLEELVAEEGDDGLEAVFGADLEDFLAELRGGANGLETDGYCDGAG